MVHLVILNDLFLTQIFTMLNGVLFTQYNVGPLKTDLIVSKRVLVRRLIQSCLITSMAFSFNETFVFLSYQFSFLMRVIHEKQRNQSKRQHIPSQLFDCQNCATAEYFFYHFVNFLVHLFSIFLVCVKWSPSWRCENISNVIINYGVR